MAALTGISIHELDPPARDHAVGGRRAFLRAAAAADGAAVAGAGIDHALTAHPARLACPCHGATFALDGTVLSHRLPVTPSPRCRDTGFVNCEKVTTSPDSVLFGIVAAGFAGKAEAGPALWRS